MPCGCAGKKNYKANAVAAKIKHNKMLQMKLNLINKTVNSNKKLPCVPIKK
jgi:hypothetical protein